ncbi:unnamed protein product [Protopolystoma xenopodis]|uniref:Uncharacterized protein n=1 Tax=Protopolystoma xenopodis TaxID=117903 RepID=A0A448WXB3_9PLAT|nr:unnamed protein product [Protopolystoma xenopodis]
MRVVSAAPTRHETEPRQRGFVGLGSGEAGVRMIIRPSWGDGRATRVPTIGLSRSPVTSAELLYHRPGRLLLPSSASDGPVDRATDSPSRLTRCSPPFGRFLQSISATTRSADTHTLASDVSATMPDRDDPVKSKTSL